MKRDNWIWGCPSMEMFERTKAKSEISIEKIRAKAKDYFSERQSILVGVNGSYARREATNGSDLDLFYLSTTSTPLDKSVTDGFDKIVSEMGFKLPSAGGVFSKALSADDMLKNIGGMEDTNESITRRLLLMLEGEWLYNQAEFSSLLHKLVSRYVNNQIPNEKICLYLLNDIIRYWRTICVDYEYKITEDKKPRGVRLIKLRFSRLMLIFAGILSVAETHNLSATEKREKLLQLLVLPGVDRVTLVVGSTADNALAHYDEFLKDIDDLEIRKRLEQVDFEQSHEYQKLRMTSKKFKEALLDLLEKKYPDKHPIHRALLL
jgi:predicted nucleotidyltransferase